MDKTATLKSITVVKEAHELQMQKLKDAIYGGETEELKIFSKSECKLGRWLYAEDNFLRDILGSLFFDNIDKIHTRWHSDYTVIYVILIKKNEKKGFFSKILNGSNISAMDLDKVKLYYSGLKMTTEAFLKALESAQRRLSALPESMFVK
ncbi:MAG: CZB domain-containing protein [Sulfurimonas sp.]|nr:CZB domain-containing protein [Sulfurimonas sp.]